MFILRILLATLLLGPFTQMGCSSSCESKATRAFQKAHPDYKIVNVHPDGNDTSVITFVAWYEKPNDSQTHFASIGAEDLKTGKCELGIHEYEKINK
jgi:hypothetical protein